MRARARRTQGWRKVQVAGELHALAFGVGWEATPAVCRMTRSAVSRRPVCSASSGGGLTELHVVAAFRGSLRGPRVDRHRVRGDGRPRRGTRGWSGRGCGIGSGPRGRRGGSRRPRWRVGRRTGVGGAGGVRRGGGGTHPGERAERMVWRWPERAAWSDDGGRPRCRVR
jgi:hypothetical protein